MKLFLALISLLVTLVSVAVNRVSLAYYPEVACDQDPPIAYDDDKQADLHQWDACKVFSSEYVDAREKFINLAKEKGADDIASLPIVDDYTTDVAIFKGTRSGAILHTSGTHGIEGYAGSAIQLALLETLGSLDSDRPTLIFVHAVNPYGMANYRRPNEHNVDLNRNGLVDFAEFLKNRHPNVAGYEDYREFISPAHEPTAWERTLGFFTRAFPLLMQHGYAKMKRVLVAGQYHHPEGIFYGGIQWEPSIVQLVQFLESRQLWDDLLVHIDVHTGLGLFGKDTLVFDSLPVDDGGVTPDKLRQVFPTAESIITPHVGDKKAMSGYDLTRGMLPHLIDHHANNNCLALAQEFGTLPVVLVGRAIMLENALHNYGANNSQNRLQARTWKQQAFYPHSTEWRASVVQRGVALMRQAIQYSKSLPVPERRQDPPQSDVVTDTNTPEEGDDTADEEVVEADSDSDNDDQQEQEETTPNHETTESA